MKKKILIVSLVFIILLCLGTNIYLIKNNNNNNKNNTEEDLDLGNVKIVDLDKVKREFGLDGLSKKSESLSINEGNSSYFLTINNELDKDYTINKLYIVFVMEEEEVRTIGLKDRTIKAKESVNVNIGFDSDLSNVKEIKYVLE